MLARRASGLAGWLAGVALVTACPSWAAAADSDYADGVQHFFAGRYDEAVSALTTAVDAGTKDPRVYYFRAVALLRQGQSAAAASDMQDGAKLEAADVHQTYSVGKSLERVQGADRVTLERYRKSARTALRKHQAELAKKRYEQLKLAEAEVLRKAPVYQEPTPETAAADRSDESAATAAPEAKSGEPNPFSDDQPAAKAPADAMPADTADEKPAAEADPFGADKGETPAEAEPAKGGAADKAPAPEADPFGAADQADQSATPPAAKSGKKPAAADKAPAAEADPFGAGDQPPTAEPPGPAKKPAAEADPLGGSNAAPADAPKEAAKAPAGAGKSGGVLGSLGKALKKTAGSAVPSLNVGKILNKVGVPVPPLPGAGGPAAPGGAAPPAAQPPAPGPDKGDPFGDDAPAPKAGGKPPADEDPFK